jgi:hypothetical protein
MQTLNKNNHGATIAQAETHLANLEPFHTGTFSGEWRDKATYVVKSYGTAIGCYGFADGWGGTPELFSEAYNYSATTTKHANIVKKAWGI